MKTRHIGFCLIGFGLLCTAVFSASSNSYSFQENKARFDRFSEKEIAELMQKKRRFDALPEVEQQRRRQLHQQILEHDKAESLLNTVDQYIEWIKSLDALQQLEILNLESVDQQIALIKDLRAGQESRIFGLAGSSALPEADVANLSVWVQDFVAKKFNEADNNSQIKRYVRRKNSEGARPWLYYYYLTRQRSIIQEQDVDNMASHLSASAREIVDKCETAEEKIRLGRIWIDRAVVAKIWPPLTDEKFKEFYKSLPPDERAQFDNMSPRTWREEITRHYYRKNSLR